MVTKLNITSISQVIIEDMTQLIVIIDFSTKREMGKYLVQTIFSVET
jgi:predicted amino acid-binding ACT domain protein